MNDLFPKPKKRWRMKAPRKATVYLRAELAEARHARDTTPRWWRVWHRIAARLVETDKQTAAEQAALERV